MFRLKLTFILILLFSVLTLGGHRGVSARETHRATFELSGSAAYALPQQRSTAGSYLAGQYAQHHQDWHTALRYFERAFDGQEQDIDVQRRMMVLAMGAGNIDSATEYATQILNAEPKNALALLFMSAKHLKNKSYLKAEHLLNNMEEGSISSFLTPLLSAWVSAAQGVDKTKTLVKISPMHTYHALLIKNYLKKPDELAPLLKTFLEQSALSAGELENIADMLLKADKTKQAKTLYARIQNENGPRKTITKKLAQIKTKTIDFKDPIYHFILTPVDGVAQAMFDMGAVLFHQQRDDTAVIFLRLAQYLRPDFAEATFFLANIMQRNGREDQAVALYQKIAKGTPYYQQALLQHANILEARGDIAQAMGILETLYAELGDVNALIMVGDIYARQDKHQQAIEAYNRAAKAMGKTPPENYWTLLYVRGISYDQNGDWEKGERDLRAALSYQPNNPHILNYLAYSWVERNKNLKEALKLLHLAVALRPDDGYIIDSLGWALYRMGRYSGAIKYLEMAAELEPYDPVINDHLGDAYWQGGRQAEARFQWRRAINYGEDEKLTNATRKKLENGLGNDFQADIHAPQSAAKI